MIIDFCNLSGWYVNNDRSTTLPSVNSTIDLSYLSAALITHPDWLRINTCFVRNELTKDLFGPASVKGKYITFLGNTSENNTPLGFQMGSINCESGLRLIGTALYAQGKSRPNIQITISNASTGIGLHIENNSNVVPYKDKSITGIANISTKFCIVEDSTLDKDINISCENIRFINESINAATINGKSQFVSSVNAGKLNNDTVFIQSTNDYAGNISSAPSAILTDNSQNFGLITAGSTFILGGSVNLGRIKSKTIFQGFASQNEGVCSGTTLFYNSINAGLVVQDALFSGLGALSTSTSSVIGGQNIKFIDSAINTGYLSGNKILFSGNATNNSQTMTKADSDLTYADYSTNTSDVSGANVVFSFNSVNQGIVRSSQKISFSNFSENLSNCYSPYIIFDNSENKAQISVKELEFINQSSNLSTIECEKVSFKSSSINKGFVGNLANVEQALVRFEKSINQGRIVLNSTSGIVLFKESRSNLDSSITSDKIILEKSYNYGLLYSVSLTELRDKSQNYGVIEGLVQFSSRSSNTSGGIVYNATFLSQSVNYGAVEYVGVFNGTINFGLVDQAGMFFAGINSGLLENFGSFVASSRNYGIIYGNAIFSGGSLNYGTCQSYTSFIDNSKNRGVLFEALFENKSVNHSTINGGATFVRGSENAGYVEGFGLLQSGSINYGLINGGANLWIGCTNKGYIKSNAYFLDSDNGAGGVVFDDVLFENSRNLNEGTISGNASFINNSFNYGLVVGTAFFDESSYNYGIVSGICLGPGCP